MTPLLKTTNLTKSYKIDETTLTILKGINLEVAQGEMLAIMGQSGSGKSTLMHLLGLLDTPTRGQILFDGADTSRLDDRQRSSFRSDRVGFVFQQFNLLKKFTALENVLMPIIYSRGKGGSEGRGRELLIEVGLEKRLDHPVSKLSGGEQQRVAIARALINDPQLILADEPTGNLDSKSGAEILSLLKRLNQKGRTIIVVTHDQTVAEACGRIVRMKDGEVVGE